MLLMLEMPVTAPPQPPVTSEAWASPTGKVSSPKKSVPFNFLASYSIS